MGQMNRAQRRAAKKSAPKKKPGSHKLSATERLAAMEKNGITVKDLKQWYEDGLKDAASTKAKYITNSFMAATAIALHDVAKFGRKRILDVLKRTEQVMLETLTADEMVKRCEYETGVLISPDDEGIDDIFKEE